MLRYLALPSLLLISACSQVQPPATVPPQMIAPASAAPSAALPSTTSKPAIVAPVSPPPAPTQSRLPLAYHRSSSNGVTLSLVSFDNRRQQLRVADQPNGLGSRWTTAQGAAATYGGLAAINGGFFTPEGKPLGLLVETSTRRGHLNRSSLGAGVFISNQSRASIVRRETYQKTANSWNAYNLLQTGPMLVENSRSVTGLSKKSSRTRSFIAWDGQNHWAIGYTSACTLDQLAKALAGNSPAGFKIKTAVNLDGGRSSDLWVGSGVRGGGKTHRGFLNKPVRNYLVLINR
ncbi:phosphodiester glycosidase family protein [Verrucomicrobiaceae bacterium 5K15]|uniref:Phosphodiester glycosidase family protein n=1 Tax=Oceaniferula flava TaxID=2800421 RepID=A0AAE2SB14_9BACT|nr:phosphodiester glycosidase family protein [Oceaniferula flavus]MBK1854573.1 phosphodiester glycosidase family protein [Oceaniferula flavus]MBM1135879.1 phosphodiester glycosidase family protein [Oceaniferula flavus]